MWCKLFLKIMTLVFSSCIFLAGVATLVVGVWLVVDSDSLLGIVSQGALPYFSSIAQLGPLITLAGVLLVPSGLLGCYGAFRENSFVLLTFFGIVVTIIIFQTSFTVVTLYLDDLDMQVLKYEKNEVINTIQTQYGANETLTSLWNATMEEFKCCGCVNYADFDESPFYNHHGDSYPLTCCNPTLIENTCSANLAQSSGIEGCCEKLLRQMEDKAMITVVLGSVFISIEIVAIFFSLLLFGHMGCKISCSGSGRNNPETS